MPSSFRTRGARRELSDSCDELEATITCPVEATGRHVHLDRAAPAPSVDHEVWVTHIAYHRHRRLRERAWLVGHYHRHVRRLARLFHRQGEALDDLEQVALEGFLLALERFDTTRSLPFLGFANPTITGTLKQHYRDHGWAMRVPRRVHDVAGPIRVAHDQLCQDLGRPPSIDEVADLTGVPVRTIRAVQEAEQARSPLSFDAPDAEDQRQVEPSAIDADAERMVDRSAVEQAVRLLPSDRRELLGLYFEDNLTQVEIAERLGRSQMHVSRQIELALTQLRSHLPT